jgi:DNA-binding NarL/FixJ family response regulator
VTRVLVVDDHAVLREGLRRSLELVGVEVVGEAGSAREAIWLAERVRADVVLLDVSLPDGDGIELAARLRLRSPELAVVVLSMFGDEATLGRAEAAGVACYLTKDQTTAEIVRAIAAAAPVGAERVGDEVLSPREVEVLQALAEGRSTKEIGEALYISAKTVKNHLGNIFAKLDAHDRTQAVLAGIRLGLVHVGARPSSASRAEVARWS